ncbi:MAG TPA: NBR1-Ig-like domain-containing protein, partial [Clostridium sp.]
MKLKRITYFLISFSLLTCMFISSSIKTNAATLSSVSYSVDNTYIQVGQTFNIYVNAQSISDLYGASVDFKYDASMLKILDITQGDVFASSGKAYNTIIKSTLPDTTGTVSIGLSLGGNIAGFIGTGKLFVLKATALKTGTINLKTTNDSSQLATNGLNMCVKLANSTTDAKITGVTYSDSSFAINKAAVLDSVIVSYNFPTTMLPGQSYPVKIVLKNTGSDNWTAAKNYKLAPLGYSDPFHNYKLVLSSNDNILPGQTKTFTYTMKAPLTQGTYTTDWQMYKEGIVWFGQSVVKRIVVANPPRASLIVSNNIPTTMVRGRNYNVKIVIKNIGSGIWTAAKKYKLAPVGYSDPFHNYK